MKASPARAILCAILAMSLGCATQYVPQRKGIAVTMRGGSVEYVLDGKKKIEAGFLGRGLVEAVKGNAQAEEAANTYYRRNRIGIGLLFGSLVCLVAPGQAIDHTESKSIQNAMVVGGLLCLLGTYVGGLATIASAAPYHLDAINIYNDGVQAGGP